MTGEGLAGNWGLKDATEQQRLGAGTDGDPVRSGGVPVLGAGGHLRGCAPGPAPVACGDLEAHRHGGSSGRCEKVGVLSPGPTGGIRLFARCARPGASSTGRDQGRFGSSPPTARRSCNYIRVVVTAPR